MGCNLKKFLTRLISTRIKAISLIEAAFGMIIFVIFATGLWSVLSTVKRRIDEERIQMYLHQISIAAANYAYQKGYLPMPEEYAEPTEDNPEQWVKEKLRGKVPWKELGMTHCPMVNGKEFTWVVSATAIKRPLPWKYSQSDRELHLLPNFCANKRWATFARPRWCGIDTEFWWKHTTKKDCNYTIQTVIRNGDDPAKYTPTNPSYKFTYLTPRPPQSKSLSGVVFNDILQIYELEMEIGLHTNGKIKEYKNEHSPLARYVGYVINADVSELVESAKLNRRHRRVWYDEQVLAITYGGNMPDPDNKLAVELTPRTLVWTRFHLLALANYFDTTFYTHPGYTWRHLSEEQKAKLRSRLELHDSFKIAANDRSKDGRNMIFVIRNTPFFLYTDKQYWSSDKECKIDNPYLHLTIRRAVDVPPYENEELLLQYACGVGTLDNKSAIIVGAYKSDNEDIYDHDFLFSAYLLEWLKAILCIECVQPLHTDDRSNICTTNQQVVAHELKLWQEAAKRILEKLEAVKAELDRIKPDDTSSILA